MKRIHGAALSVLIALLAISFLACTPRVGYVTVTFDYNFAGSAPVNRTIVKGDTIDDMEEPERAGFRFEGWFTDADCPEDARFSFKDGIQSDITLYAKWSELINVTLRYDVGDAVGSLPEVACAIGDTVELDDGEGLALEGYAFDGWNDGTQVYEGGATYQVQKQVTFTAVWVRVTNVSFAAGGAQGDTPQAQEVRGDSYVLPSQGGLTKTGYTFTGWSDGVSIYGEGESYAFTQPEVTFTAVWSGSYRLIFDPDFTGGTAPDEVSGNSGTSAVLPAAPARENYVFIGWSDGKDLYREGDSYRIGYGDTTFVAVWTNQVEVVFYYNYYGNQEKYETQQIVVGNTVDRPLNPRRDKHVFSGWYTDADCSTEWNFRTKITQALTLYAGWKHEYYEFIPVLNGEAWEITRRDDISIEENSVTYRDYANIRIPESYDGKPVIGVAGGSTVAASGFFLTRNLESVYFPASITYIGGYAFNLCYKITEITFEQGSQLESIGDHAFGACRRLKILEFPASLKTIGDEAFGYCVDTEDPKIHPRWGLESVTFEAGSKLESIGRGAFWRNYLLTQFDMPDTVTEIGDFAFNQCRGLAEIVLPNNLKRIGAYAFAGCMDVNGSVDFFGANPMIMSTIRIPASVTEIAEYAFSFNDLSQGIVFEGDSQLSLIARCAFYGSNLTTIEVPKGVTGIGYAAFMRSKIERITFAPDSKLQIIGDYAFSECEIRGIDIPEGVETILYSVFQSAKNLEYVTLPSTLQVLGSEVLTVTGSWAFYNCTKLTSVTFAAESRLTLLDSMTFFGCASLTEIQLPKSMEIFGDNLFGGCVKLNHIDIQAGSRHYSSQDGVVYNAAKDVLIYYPQAKPEQILRIPEGITALANYAFYQCQNVQELYLPASLKTIGNAAIRYCQKLIKIEFTADSQLEKIGNAVFANNTVTKTVDGIMIGQSSTLTELTFTAVTPPQMGADCFAWSLGVGSVRLRILVPAGSVEAYKSANRWKDYAAYIEAIPQTA